MVTKEQIQQLAIKYNASDIPLSRLAIGINKELKETNDVDVAAQKAIEHLREQPYKVGFGDYYSSNLSETRVLDNVSLPLQDLVEISGWTN